VLFSTGRVSSEMLLKAARMGVPIVASRTSPTEMAVALAEQLGVTVCGYVRPDSLNVLRRERGGVRRAAPELEGPPGRRDAEARAYRRGFRQKSKRDDYALDLFHEARAKLGTDDARVDQALRELSRLYNPLADGPIVGLGTRARIMTLLARGDPMSRRAAGPALPALCPDRRCGAQRTALIWAPGSRFSRRPARPKVHNIRRFDP